MDAIRFGFEHDEKKERFLKRVLVVFKAYNFCGKKHFPACVSVTLMERH